MGKKISSTDIKEYLGKEKKENMTRYEITHFDLVSKNFSLPLSLSFCLNNHAYMLVIDGKAQMNISGYTYALSPNSIVALVPSHTFQFIEINKNFKAIGLIFKKEFTNVMPSTEKIFKYLNRNLKIFKQPVIQSSDREFQTLMDCISGVKLRMAEKSHLMQKELIENAFITFLLEWINCFDNHISHDSPKIKSAHSEQILNSFIVLLRKHFREEHLVRFYADKLCISSQYLTTIIKRLTGMTVNEFVYDILYSEASILLDQTDLSIQQIAEKLHFSDASAFCKFFKRRSGISPLKFRNK